MRSTDPPCELFQTLYDWLDVFTMRTDLEFDKPRDLWPGSWIEHRGFFSSHPERAPKHRPLPDDADRFARSCQGIVFHYRDPNDTFWGKLQLSLGVDHPQYPEGAPQKYTIDIRLPGEGDEPLQFDVGYHLELPDGVDHDGYFLFQGPRSLVLWHRPSPVVLFDSFTDYIHKGMRYAFVSRWQHHVVDQSASNIQSGDLKALSRLSLPEETPLAELRARLLAALDPPRADRLLRVVGPHARLLFQR